jgi:hypothetical protein
VSPLYVIGRPLRNAFGEPVSFDTHEIVEAPTPEDALGETSHDAAEIAANGPVLVAEVLGMVTPDGFERAS